MEWNNKNDWFDASREKEGRRTAMEDKAFNIFLMVLFGMGGITILILAYMHPMPLPERILTIVIGSAGPLGVLIRALLLKSKPAEVSGEKYAAKAETKAGHISTS